MALHTAYDPFVCLAEVCGLPLLLIVVMANTYITLIFGVFSVSCKIFGNITEIMSLVLM